LLSQSATKVPNFQRFLRYRHLNFVTRDGRGDTLSAAHDAASVNQALTKFVNP